MKITVKLIREVNPDALDYLAEMLYDFMKKEWVHIPNRQTSDESTKLHSPALEVSSKKL